MNAIPRNQVQTINTGMSIGITFKLMPGPTMKVDGEVDLYLEKVVEVVKEFQNCGWDVHEQEVCGNRYLVCAKYYLDRPDHKLIDKAREIVDQYAPHDFDREYIPL